MYLLIIMLVAMNATAYVAHACGWFTTAFARFKRRLRAPKYAHYTLATLPPLAGGADVPANAPAFVDKSTIPETAEGLAELLADDKRRQEVFANADTTADFLKKYDRTVEEKRPDIKRQIDDGVQTGLRAFLLDNGVLNRPNPDAKPDTTQTLNSHGAGYNRRAIGVALDKEFADITDFMQSVWHGNGEGGGASERWRRIRNDYSSIDPSTGGFLVPEVLRSELLRVALETAIVRGRARVIPMDSNRVPFPAIDSTSNASTIFGGITASWTEEGATLGESEAKFGRVILDAKKLAARCDVPNELLQDSIISFGAFINDVLPQAIAWFEDIGFTTGVGAGEPQGWNNANALVTVNKESGQVANSIVWENIVKLYSRMLPSSMGNAVWVANNDTFPELATMALSVGTGGSGIWLNNGVVGPPMSILGRPVVFTEKVPTLGTTLDISLVDFGYYLIGDRQEMRAESSAHAQFTSDQTVYRIIERIDGRPWLQSAITPNQGTNTLSPFVTLQTRS